MPSSLFGKTRETVVGASLNAVADEQRAEIYRNRDLELLASDGQQIYEAQVVAADGNIHDVIFHKAVVRSADGSAEGIVGAMLDVTHMRGIEADLRTLNQNLEARVAARTGELARANAELERTIDSLSLAQDELGRQERLSSLGSMVAGVAHELNTPIGNSLTVATTLQEAASAFTQEVAGGTLETFDAQRFLDPLHGRLRHAGAQLRARCPADQQLQGKWRSIRPATAGAALCSETASMKSSRPSRPAPPAHIPGSPSDIPAGIALESYPGALGQILLNLLENARIHAFSDIPMGEVRIAATMTSDEAVRINIGDNGKGIPAGDLVRVFDPLHDPTRAGRQRPRAFDRLSPGHPDTRRPHPCQQRHGRGTMFVLDLPLNAPLQEGEAAEQRGPRSKGAELAKALPAGAGTPPRRSTSATTCSTSANWSKPTLPASQPATRRRLIVAVSA